MPRAEPSRLEAPAGPIPRVDPSVGWIWFSAVDWWYHNRAHSDFQLARAIAAHRTVLFLNSIGLRMPAPGRSTNPLRRILRKAGSAARLLRRPDPARPNFRVLTPWLLPFYGSPAARRMNARLVRSQVSLAARHLGIRDAVVLVTIPTAWEVVEPMRRRALLFNHSDKHSTFPEADGRFVESLETALLRRSDAVLYVSGSLQEEDAPLAGDRARFLDHGVDLEHFDRRRAKPEPADLRPLGRPRIGFFGGFDDYVVDFELLERTARAIPEATMVLVGDSTCSMDRLTSLPNVRWLGFRPYASIPAYGAGFDVALMPWLRSPWIRYSNPIKLKEYLALGLPIVSTDFPEVHRYARHVRIARTSDEFVAHVRRTLEDGGPGTPEDRRSSVADCSWDERAAALLHLGESFARDRRSERPAPEREAR